MIRCGNHVGNVIGAVLLSSLVLSCSTAQIGTNEEPSAEIYGEVGGCFAQKQVFMLGDVKIYVFPFNPDGELYKALESVPESADSPTEIASFIGARDSLIAMVKSQGASARQTQSNSDGQYLIRGLHPGKRFLVIGIVPPEEDYEEYFVHVVTEPLSPGRQRVDLWESDIPKSECRE